MWPKLDERSKILLTVDNEYHLILNGSSSEGGMGLNLRIVYWLQTFLF